MNDEEFERWKEENGWYTTWGDVVMILGFIALMIFAVKLS